MSSNTKKELILSLGLLLLVNEAYAMRYDLPRMVRMSGLIAVVAPAQPATYEERISGDKQREPTADDLNNPPLSNPDSPPHVRLVYRFVIKSVLHGNGQVGDYIDVIPANADIGESDPPLWMNVSYDYDVYRSKYKVNDGGERIVFLRPYGNDEARFDQDGWRPDMNRRPAKFYRFVADPGYEGLEAGPEIERLIKTPPAPEVFDDPFDG